MTERIGDRRKPGGLTFSDFVDAMVDATFEQIVDRDDSDYARAWAETKIPDLAARFLEDHDFDPEEAR